MDPFDVRIEFNNQLNRLSSSLQSINKLAQFVLKNSPRCADDLWDCLTDECAATRNPNVKLNLLYFLDSLLQLQGKAGEAWRALLTKGLDGFVGDVVPEGREGRVNVGSAMQVLRSWRTRRLLDLDLLDGIIAKLDARRQAYHDQPPDDDAGALKKLDKRDILQRIEDDRERHKRLRERAWVLPIPAALVPAPLILATQPQHSQPLPTSASNSAKPSPYSPASPSEMHPPPVPPHKAAASRFKKTQREPPQAATPPPRAEVQKGPEVALELEFEQLWEAAEEERLGEDGGSKRRRVDEDGGVGVGTRWELTEVDRVAMREQAARCFVK